MENYVQIKKRHLLFREDARNLAESIYKKAAENKAGVIFLDFSCVDFMSRGFVDELLNVLDELKKNNIEVKPIYLKTVLRGFLSLVKKKKNKIQRALTIEDV